MSAKTHQMVASPVAAVLNGAADLIERDGWTQGNYEKDGGYCIAGAIDAAAECRNKMMTSAAVWARRFVADLVGTHVCDWNDRPGRTKDEVCRRAASRGRACRERGMKPATVASPVANVWETLARERKARAIATTLMRVLPSITADEAAALDSRGRRAAAMLARVRPCSDEAWAMVVNELRRCGR